MLLIYLDMIIISVVVIVGGAHCGIGSYNIVCVYGTNHNLYYVTVCLQHVMC